MAAANLEQRQRMLELQVAASLQSLQAARRTDDQLAAALAEHDLNTALEALNELKGASCST